SHVWCFFNVAFAPYSHVWCFFNVAFAPYSPVWCFFNVAFAPYSPVWCFFNVAFAPYSPVWCFFNLCSFCIVPNRRDALSKNRQLFQQFEFFAGPSKGMNEFALLIIRFYRGPCSRQLVHEIGIRADRNHPHKFNQSLISVAEEVQHCVAGFEILLANRNHIVTVFLFEQRYLHIGLSTVARRQ